MEHQPVGARRAQTEQRTVRSFSRVHVVLGGSAIAVIMLLLGWFVIRPMMSGTGQQMPLQQSSAFTSVFDSFEVSGRVGATPVLDLKSPVLLSGSKDRVLIQGNGRTISKDSPVVVAITAYDGQTGHMLNPSGQPKIQVGFANEQTFAPDFLRVVVGRTEGSRIGVVRHLAPNAVAEGSSSEYEIDVIDVLPSIATGVEQPENNGAPLTVDISETGPRVTHGEQVPSGLTTQILIKGEGPQVNSSGKVIAQYSLAGWSDGVVRQSTWNQGIPELIDLSTAMPGLVQALADQRVGSRIAITIPPDLATGEDTMTAVVDILAATHMGESSRPSESSESEGNAQSQ